MIRSTQRRSGRLFVNLAAILSLTVLSFLLGTAVVWFGWPLSDLLTKGLMGAQDVLSGNKLVERDEPSIAKDEPGKTFDGFTLYTREAAPRASLVDMKGTVVHSWEMRYRNVWPAPGEEPQAWFRACHLYPNGDLLAVFGGPKNPPEGCGLVKLDKDSKVIWKYGAAAHDALDVDADGNIYTLVQRNTNNLTEEMKKDGFTVAATLDYLVVLSPDGKEVDSIPLWQAFHGGTASYSPLLAPAEPKTEAHKEMRGTSVQLLGKEIAGKFPLLKAGQVMIALPGIDALAVVDIKDRTVAWAGRGPWLSPQGCQFLDNGDLLVFDRLGSLKAPRLLRYNPKDLTVPWMYYTGNTGNSKFDAEAERYCSGCCQRLPKGNTLVLTSRDGELLELNEDKDVVWRCQCGAGIPFARRYAPDQVRFLEGGESAKPR
jgi:hypothetical protein